jgi:O-antigen/teichoic acid export membrane protein
MLIALAKISTPEAVGKFSLGLAITAPIFAFSNMQLSGMQATDIRVEHTFSAYLGFRLVSSAIAVMLITGVALISGVGNEIALVVFVFGLAKAIESVSDVIYGRMQQHEQMQRIAISLLLKGPLSLAALVVGIMLSGRVVVGVLAMAVTWAGLLVLYDLPGARAVAGKVGNHAWSGPTFVVAEMRQILQDSLPMGFVIMLNAASINLPRYFVAEYYGEAAVGYFVAIGYLLVAGSLVVNAVGQAAMPRLARHYANDLRAYRSLLFKAFLIAALLGMGGILVAYWCGAELLSILYTESYGKYADVFFWTMVGALILYCVAMLGCGISAAREFRSQAVVTAVSTFTILILCYVLVPDYGMVGAAMSFVGGISLKLVLQFFQLRSLTEEGRWQRSVQTASPRVAS